MANLANVAKKGVEQRNGVAEKPRTFSQESIELDPNVREVVEKSLEDVEGADVMGNVSEKAGSSKDKRTGGATAQVRDFKAIKEELLRNLPEEAQMKKQVEREVRKEIKVLKNRFHSLLKSSVNPDYSEMNNIVRKIRELKEILYSLLRGSFESLKSLWLRYVHKIE